MLDNGSTKLVGYADTVIKIVAGAMKGSEFPLTKPEVTVGRSKEADIQINDTQISRVHCRLTWADGAWHIQDEDSTNGTWMVGQKVNARVRLPLRASVRIGNTIFELYDIYVSEATQMMGHPVVTYRIEPSTLAGSGDDESGRPLQVVKEESRRLTAVYKFFNSISAVFEEKALHRQILSAVTNLIAADEAYLLLYSVETGDFAPVSGRTRSKSMQRVDPSAINQSVVSFVKENREAVLSSSVVKGQPVPGLPDMPDLTTSIMCVPMFGKQQLNGMLYLTLCSSSAKYNENDLRLLTVIGHTAGMAIENTRLVEFNLKNERLVAAGATAAGLSHYIKNILTGLDGSVRMLKMGIDHQDANLVRDSFAILQRNYGRLEDLVLDLLNLASEQKPCLAMRDLRAIIRDAVELMADKFAQESIVATLPPGDAPLMAEIDDKGVHRVLLNLLNNAEAAILAARSEGGRPGAGRIDISAAFSPGCESISVTVRDDGIGMRPEIIGNVFDLFMTTKGHAGTGLGLAVSKRLVEAHGGAITAASVPNEWTALTFTLPVTQNYMSTSTKSISIKELRRPEPCAPPLNVWN